MVRAHRSVRGQLGVSGSGSCSEERQPKKLVTTGGMGHKLGIEWSPRSLGISILELGSRPWCRLTLVVRLWPRHRSELGLGLQPES